MEWVYWAVGVLSAQAAGILQVLYRRAYLKVTTVGFFMAEGICSLSAWVFIALAVTDDFLFSAVFGAVMTLLALFALFLLRRAIFKNEPSP